jgi:hypothetical protein
MYKSDKINRTIVILIATGCDARDFETVFKNR